MRIPERVRKSLCSWALDRMYIYPPDFIVGGAEHPYLRRWWIIPRNRVFNVYLHQFLRSDDDRALHDHMYVNCSLLLSGSYLEWKKDCMEVRDQGSVVLRKPTTAHRIQLLVSSSGFGELPVTTLFITGPRVRNWGFHCPQGWRPWQKFVNMDSPGEVGPGCGE